MSSKSTSANASPQLAASHFNNSNSTTGASPYGTRSRNRASNSRPNYAEDKDTEMDFEYTTSRTSQASAAPASQPMQRKISSGSYGKKNTANNVAPRGANVAAAAALKEPIPGTSSFSVNDSQSKKRKAPGSSATTNPASSSSQQPPSSSTRKSSQSANLNQSAYRDSNVVTFENNGAYLSHGSLTADDKTKYRVNGEAPHPHHTLFGFQPTFLSTTDIFSQTTSISCVSRPGNLITWPGSWNSYILVTAPTLPSIHFASTGCIVLGTLVVNRQTPA